MSSGRLLDPLRRSLAVRLSLWFALVFGVCVAALFFGSYRVLAGDLERRSYEELRVRFDRYARLFNIWGSTHCAAR